TSLMDLRTIADWTIRPRLLAVPGIAQVTTFGGEVKQYQVIPDPVKLKDYGVTLAQVVTAARSANENAGAGFFDTSQQSMVIQGGILVIVVLILFLLSWRAGVISFTAIPLSLLAAIIVLERLGGTINTLTLGGLAIAIGEVVDDAIIDVENVFRRLRENRAREKLEPVLSVIYHASAEVRTAVVYATFIVALVFVPVLTLTGIPGKFFAPLALAYIL